MLNREIALFILLVHCCATPMVLAAERQPETSDQRTQQPTSQPAWPPFESPGKEMRDLAWLAGHWSVTTKYFGPDGKVYPSTTESVIQPILGGSFLQEQITIPAFKLTMTGLRSYDRFRKVYRFIWLDNIMSLADVFEGGPVDGGLIVSNTKAGTSSIMPGGPETHLRFTQREGPTRDQFTLIWEASTDAGQTWRKTAEYEYSRKIPPVEPGPAEPHHVLLTFAGSDGAPLEARLTLPPGRTGPVPVVLFLHGAGARAFDGPFMYLDAQGEARVGRFLDFHASELTRRGVALCAMSKRGCTAQPAPPGMRVDRQVFSKATPSVLLDDYAHCLAALRSRDEIDPERIVLLGSSEGTRLAPQLALRSPAGIVGVAMMGYAADNARATVEWQHSVGPWRNIQHLFPAARDGELTLAEYDQAAKNDARAAGLPFAGLDADHDERLTPEDMRTIIRPRLDAIIKAVEDRDDDFLWSQLQRLSSAYLLEWWEAEPNGAFLARLDVPLAIFHGELDGTCRVEGVRETEAALRELGRRNLTVFTYADADHDLNWTLETSKSGGPPAYREAFDLIVRWCAHK